MGKIQIPDPSVTMLDNKSTLLPGRAGVRGRNFQPLVIVMHIQQGTNYLPSFFASVQADSTMWSMKNGTMVRMLQDSDMPWTNGPWDAPDLTNPVIAELRKAYGDSNEVSLTIEHQGWDYEDITKEQIESDAKMVAYWSVKYNIPIDRNHIIGHYQVGPHHQCPGPKFPYQAIIDRAKQIVGQYSTPPANFEVVEIPGTGEKYRINDPIYSFWKANPWLGYPRSPELASQEYGLEAPGSFQAFDKMWVEVPDATGQPRLTNVGLMLWQIRRK